MRESHWVDKEKNSAESFTRIYPLFESLYWVSGLAWLQRGLKLQVCSRFKRGTGPERQCFETLRIMRERASGQKLWTFVSGKFLVPLFLFVRFSLFFPPPRSSRHPARGRNNLYSWGLFLKGTATIYLSRFLPPLLYADLIVIWSRMVMKL